MKTRIAACAIQITSTSNEVQLFPAGTFSALDGRPRDVDGGKWILNDEHAAIIVAQVAATQRRFVIDYEHQTLRAATNGKPAPAAGFFSRVEWRPGSGLWAVDVEWTPRAAEMIAAGEYLYISPVFLYNKRGEVLYLRHAALTNDPALDGMEEVMLAAANYLASLSTEPEENPVDEELLNDLLQSLRWTLNLPATATAQDIAAELQKIINAVSAGQGMAAASVGLLTLLQQKDEQIAALSASAYNPEKHVPIEAFTALQQKMADVSAAAASVQVDEMDTLIQAALTDARLLPEQETWARELASQNAEALKSFLKSAPKIAALTQQQSGGQKMPTPEDKNLVVTELDDEQLAICRTFGNDPADIAKLIAEE